MVAELGQRYLVTVPALGAVALGVHRKTRLQVCHDVLNILRHNLVAFQPGLRLRKLLQIFCGHFPFYFLNLSALSTHFIFLVTLPEERRIVIDCGRTLLDGGATVDKGLSDGERLLGTLGDQVLPLFVGFLSFESVVSTL